jgi:hypothetical protein
MQTYRFNELTKKQMLALVFPTFIPTSWCGSRRRGLQCRGSLTVVTEVQVGNHGHSHYFNRGVCWMIKTDGRVTTIRHGTGMPVIIKTKQDPRLLQLIDYALIFTYGTPSELAALKDVVTAKEMPKWLELIKLFEKFRQRPSYEWDE